MMDWFAADPANKGSVLAKIADVQAPSVHAWRWLDSDPEPQHQKAIARTIGATMKDWKTPLAGSEAA